MRIAAPGLAAGN